MTAESGKAESDWIGKVNEVATRIRRRGFEYVMHNDGGYLSQICSSAEIFAWLYCRGMHLGESAAPDDSRALQIGAGARTTPSFRFSL